MCDVVTRGRKGPYWYVSMIREPVPCGSDIRLQHANTKAYLHSHQHISPLSHQQEVSCFDGEDTGNIQWKRMDIEEQQPHMEKTRWWLESAMFKLKYQALASWRACTICACGYQVLSVIKRTTQVWPAYPRSTRSSSCQIILQEHKMDGTGNTRNGYSGDVDA